MIDATGMPQTAVVIGGSSDIARATMSILARRRLVSVVLGGRTPADLEQAAAELVRLGVKEAHCLPLDLTDPASLQPFADDSAAKLGNIDLVLMAAGLLGEADLTTLDPVRVAEMGAANFSGPAALLIAFAKLMKAQGCGRIVILSSVAGVRVRKANFVYGATKAGLDGFGLGLADVLAGSGVKVTVVRPGYVRTKMTADVPEAPMAVEPPAVAEAIVRGMEKGSEVVWVPPALQAVFAVFQLLPKAIWRRLPG
jgi:decaprenylphospho-beta-D-erythro-pentofuranosid-2-ulose 2-reductase